MVILMATVSYIARGIMERGMPMEFSFLLLKIPLRHPISFIADHKKPKKSRIILVYALSTRYVKRIHDLNPPINRI